MDDLIYNSFLKKMQHAISMVRHMIKGPFDELQAAFFTALEAHTEYYLENDKFVRTTTVDTLGVMSTDFNLGSDQKEALYQSGKKGSEGVFRSLGLRGIQSAVP